MINRIVGGTEVCDREKSNGGSKVWFETDCSWDRSVSGTQGGEKIVCEKEV